MSTVETFLHELAHALSKDDIEALVAHSPRLRRTFPSDVFSSLYRAWLDVPAALRRTFELYGNLPTEPVMWRGAYHTGVFTVETHDRSYSAHGTVRAGAVSGLLTVEQGGRVSKGLFVGGVPHGTWETLDEQTGAVVATLPYVDGMLQGTATDGGTTRLYINNQLVEETRSPAAPAAAAAPASVRAATSPAAAPARTRRPRISPSLARTPEQNRQHAEASDTRYVAALNSMRKGDRIPEYEDFL